jgi:putative two-component system response regulator
MNRQVLFVDDDPAVLDGLQRAFHMLGSEWDMTCAITAESAWQRLQDKPFDAVVTDIRMPGLSGLDLLARIRRTASMTDLPVVMLTGMSDHHLKQQALALGASDLFNKPVEVGDLVARLRNAISLKSQRDEMKSTIDTLQREVSQRRSELLAARMNAVCRLAVAADRRDWETGNHVVRVGQYSHTVAQAMRVDPALAESILVTAPLHDIGKIAVPDHILRKLGPLDADEEAIFQRHCTLGQQILRRPVKAASALLDGHCFSIDDEGADDPFLKMSASIAFSHHEKWDGSGYPQGLAGTQIPLEARIVAVCDVFDELTSRRPHKEPLSEEESLRILNGERERHFDPTVVAAFMESLPKIRAIRTQYSDPPAPRAQEQKETP